MAKSKGNGSPEPQDELAELLQKNAAPPAAPVQQSTPSAEESRFEQIPLNRIKPSPTNPRTTFDEKETQELAESIKIHGVIQPVTVRPYGQPGWYQLVCGQRREKASHLAGKTHIPAIVRDLTDEQVIEIQITENLQRKDINPIEEANGFKNLMDIKGYTVKELHERIGKPQAFISQRLKLNDLAPEFQKAMFENRLTITDGLKLAKLREVDQQELYRDCNMQEGGIRVNDNMLRKYLYDLNYAPFDTKDPTILPGMKGCDTCTYNTACSTAIFADPASEARCTYSDCFKKKTDVWYKRELDKATNDPLVELVTEDGYYPAVEELRKNGVTVHHQKMWSEITDPCEFELPWHLEDPEEYDGNNYEAEVAEAKRDHANEVAEYQQEIQTATRAFVVEGNDKGKYIYIRWRVSNSHDFSKISSSEATPNAAKIASIQNEIKRIQDKEARQVDLDYMKVLHQIHDEIEESGIHTHSTKPLTRLEMATAIMELHDISYLQDVKQLLKVPSSCYGDIAIFNFLLTRSDDQLAACITMLLRSRMLYFMHPGNEQTPTKHVNCHALMEQYKARIPDSYAKVMTALDDKKTKRARKVQSAIDELQDQLKEIQGSKTDRVVKASKSKMGGG